jgi:EF hand
MTPLRLGLATLATLAALATGAAAVPFSKADMNGDGVVTYPEARRTMPRLNQVHFEKCDPNQDGVITQREFPLLNNFYRMVYRDLR